MASKRHVSIKDWIACSKDDKHSKFNSQLNWATHFIYLFIVCLFYFLRRYSYELQRLWGKMATTSIGFANHLVLIVCFISWENCAKWPFQTRLPYIFCFINTIEAVVCDELHNEINPSNLHLCCWTVLESCMKFTVTPWCVCSLLRLQSITLKPWCLELFPQIMIMAANIFNLPGMPLTHSLLCKLDKTNQGCGKLVLRLKCTLHDNDFGTKFQQFVDN